MQSIPDKDPANFPIEHAPIPNENQNVENKQAKKKGSLGKKIKPNPDAEGLGLMLIKEGVKRVSKAFKATSKPTEKTNPEKVNNTALENPALNTVNTNNNSPKIEENQPRLNIMDEFMAEEFQLQHDQTINSLNLQAFDDVRKTLPEVGNTLDSGFLLKSSSEPETPKTAAPKSERKTSTPKKTEEKNNPEKNNTIS